MKTQFLPKIKTKFSQIFKKALAFSPVLLISLLGFTIMTVPGGDAYALEETWGPQDREFFTWETPATFPTFNSIRSNPFIGDETNFVRVKEYVEGEEGDHVDNVTVEPGKEYEVWIYFHNNAGANFNSTGQGLAQNTRIATSFPTRLEAGDSGIIRGSVSSTTAKLHADDAEAGAAYWDTAFFNANTTVYLTYVPESAELHYNDWTDDSGIVHEHNCKSANELHLGEAIFADSSEVGHSLTAGAKITCMYRENDEDYNNRVWGLIPGCNEYAGYVTYRVRVDQPRFWVEKTVSQAGADVWDDKITANPGDELDFKIYYINTGTTEQTAVNFHDKLPNLISLVPDTAHIVTPLVPNGMDLDETNQSNLFNDATGLNVGNFTPQQSATLTYHVKLDENWDNYSCGENVFYNDVEVETENGSEMDKVKITVNKSCDNPDPGPTPDPNPEPTCATNPELPGCQRIVNTGPVEITLACIILLGIGGITFYLIRTRRTLAKVENGVAGKKSQKDMKAQQDSQNDIKNDVKAQKDGQKDGLASKDSEVALKTEAEATLVATPAETLAKPESTPDLPENRADEEEKK